MTTILRSGLLRFAEAGLRPSPSLFCLPGLATAPFWDNAAPWRAAVQAHWREIRDEYVAVRARRQSDYTVGDGEHRLHQGQWEWRSLMLKGKWQPEMEELCPTTARVLRESVPDLCSDMPFAYCFFSTLPAGAAIAPHFGPSNLRLRCHLALDVPEGGAEQCGIRVGLEDPRPWRAGEAMLFDDAYEHETWNKTAQDRVVLLFDVWHPDLSPVERQQVVNMFKTIS